MIFLWEYRYKKSIFLEVPNLKIRSQLGFEEIITRLPSTNSSKTHCWFGTDDLDLGDLREQIEKKLGMQDGNGKKTSPTSR